MSTLRDTQHDYLASMEKIPPSRMAIGIFWDQDGSERWMWKIDADEWRYNIASGYCDDFAMAVNVARAAFDALSEWPAKRRSATPPPSAPVQT